ncbi:hypothetical protein Ahy_A07g033547 [Arachis hypogaea]|uniref:Aminotransferase-like plant mobile domain-containing protein n=1 Tax=Arachis hypogaea TaxID=3818 RepID=A0A445C9I3_ARAHY|nr:hypothetical protein Ahy_A07g033547 [Arachis hypogaea]
MARQAGHDGDINRLNETSHYAGTADFERPRLLLPRRVNHTLLPPDAIVLYLAEAGFGDTMPLRDFTFDNSLISALVERWCPEMHTFHLPWGQVTITLQDVVYHLGLRAHGNPVGGACVTLVGGTTRRRGPWWSSSLVPGLRWWHSRQRRGKSRSIGSSQCLGFQYLTTTGRDEDVWWPERLQQWYDSWRQRFEPGRMITVHFTIDIRPTGEYYDWWRGACRVRHLSGQEVLEDSRLVELPPDIQPTASQPRDDVTLLRGMPDRRRHAKEVREDTRRPARRERGQRERRPSDPVRKEGPGLDKLGVTQSQRRRRSSTVTRIWGTHGSWHRERPSPISPCPDFQLDAKISPASGSSYGTGLRPGSQYAIPPSHDYGMYLSQSQPQVTPPVAPHPQTQIQLHQFATGPSSGEGNRLVFRCSRILDWLDLGDRLSLPHVALGTGATTRIYTRDSDYSIVCTIVALTLSMYF